LGFFRLSTRISHTNETKGWLWLQALTKPASEIGSPGKAGLEVLPAASYSVNETFLCLDISFGANYKRMPPDQILSASTDCDATAPLLHASRHAVLAQHPADLCC
jgi:hypothetical protein